VDRRFQFGLKTVFALTTAVAVVLVAWLYLPLDGLLLPRWLLLAFTLYLATATLACQLIFWLLAVLLRLIEHREPLEPRR
jgi:hypothetical protein